MSGLDRNGRKESVFALKDLELFCFYFAFVLSLSKDKKVDGSSQSVKGTGSFLCFNILITFTQAGP